MQRFPIDLTGEYVGTKPAGQFTSRDTGEVVAIPPKVQFLRRDESGEVSLLEVSGKTLDGLAPAFDHGKLNVGDRVRVRGEVVLQDRGSDRDSYFAVKAAEVVEGAVKPQRVAA
jgi:hypothetical protein